MPKTSKPKEAVMPKAPPTEARRSSWSLALVCLLLAMALGAGGYFYLSRRQMEARADAHRELSTIAGLKLGQLKNWREERLSDARFFSHALFVAQDVQRFLAEPGSQPAQSALLHWLSLLKAGDRYCAVMVLDGRLTPRLALPASAAAPGPATRQVLGQVARNHDIVFGDLYRDQAGGPVYLDIAFPVFEGADAKQGALLATVLLKLDARQFLFPLLQTWPTPSETAETLLVRRDGDSVLFLNDLRHRPGAALTLRLPLNLPNLPAAKIARGDQRVLEGVDYRGVPVVAVGRPVPGTSWSMVAKIDREEVYAPLRQQTLAVLTVLGALLLAGALLVGFFWRQRTALFLERELAGRKAHEHEMERISRLYVALSQVNQAVVRANSRDELLRLICGAFVQSGGFLMAWVGWVDPVTKRVAPVAQQGDNGYLQRISVYADDRPQGRGPVGTSIREGRCCASNDIQGDPKMLPWHEAATQAGWHSLAAFPIREEGRICGALAVYAGENDFFGDQEQALVQEAADDVSFGLDTLLNQERRRQAEEALQKARDTLASANVDLEQQVQQRTAQLLEANSNLQTFTYSAAHDMRSPLRAISSFTEIVLQEHGGELKPDARSMLERVRGSANQMAELLNDLLDYSRMSQAELKLEALNLQNIVADALRLLDPEIRARDAVVTQAGPFPDVIGHAATLLVLINNLVSNALKFMQPGAKPEVRLSAEKSGHYIRLVVQDNGIGIAPEQLQKLFTPFQRLHSRQAYPGTGLGLAIVRKAAERMGGRVGVESEPGKGSRFWVELPAAGSSAAATSAS
jgi:signal transduction histidine kinase